MSGLKALPSRDEIQLTCRLEVLPGSSARDQMEAAKRFGFDGIALPGRFINQWIESVRKHLRDLPLPLASISLGFEKSLLSAREEDRKICYDSLLRLLDLCAELKVKRLNVPPCLIQDNPGRIQDPGRYSSVTERLDALLLEQLPALGDAARDRGVILLIEPVNRYETEYLTSIEHAARLCAQLNHSAIGLTADFFHMQMEELQPDEAIRRAGPWIRHVHVAENTRVEPGPGSLDFAQGFSALREIGYQGLIEVECRSLSGTPEEALAKSVQFLRRTWRQAAPQRSNGQ